jgi:FkbH-like protein
VERDRLRASLGEEGYLAGLGMVVEVWENARGHAARIHDLSNKTNQFNLRLSRLSEGDVQRLLGDGNVTFTVGLRDSLADSGIVGVLAFERTGEEAALVEFLMSCRALGRDVEAVALSRALRRLGELGISRVRIEPREGPRNGPALAFLGRFVRPDEPLLPLSALRARIDAAVARHPAQVQEHR